jgi:hypothetical protein
MEIREEVLRRIVLSEAHSSTGAVRHFSDGRLLSIPHELRIVRYVGGSGGYYLFYFDAQGALMTDTFHSSLEEALEEADREFRVKANEWEILIPT